MPCSDMSRWACHTSGVSSRLRKSRTSSRNAVSSSVSFNSIVGLACRTGRRRPRAGRSPPRRCRAVGQDFVGVFAEQRRPAVFDAQAVHAPGQAELAMRPGGRMIDGDDAAVGLELSVVQHFIATQHRTGRHACRLQLSTASDADLTRPAFDRERRAPRRWPDGFQHRRSGHRQAIPHVPRPA